MRARDDGVHHPVLEQKFAALEAFGKLLADGLLDDSRAGKADERLWLGQHHVPQPGEACRHAPSRGVQHDGDVGFADAAKAGDGG
jgi:hypothetical protein